MPIQHDSSGGYAVRSYTFGGVTHKMKVHLNTFIATPPFNYTSSTGTNPTVTADLTQLDANLVGLLNTGVSLGTWLITQQPSQDTFVTVGAVATGSTAGTGAGTTLTPSTEATITLRAGPGRFMKLGLYGFIGLNYGKVLAPPAGVWTNLIQYFTGLATNIVSKGNAHASALVSISAKQNNRTYRKTGA